MPQTHGVARVTALRSPGASAPLDQLELYTTKCACTTKAPVTLLISTHTQSRYDETLSSLICIPVVQDTDTEADANADAELGVVELAGCGIQYACHASLQQCQQVSEGAAVNVRSAAPESYGSSWSAWLVCRRPLRRSGCACCGEQSAH